MLERFLSLSEYVAPILIRNSNAPDMISGTQMNILKEVLQILSPIEKVSKEICGEKYLTASKIIPIINCLHKQIENLIPISEEAIILKNVAISEINKRFGAIEYTKLLALSTLLDPRFKRIHFNNSVACSQTIATVNQLYKESFMTKETKNLQELSISTIDEQESNKINKSLWDFHEQLASKNNEKENMEASGFCSEIKNYVNSNVIPLKHDPIEYWQSQTNHILRDIVLKYISIIGTSVPSERLFSKAGLIITETRNRLQGKRLFPNFYF